MPRRLTLLTVGLAFSLLSLAGIVAAADAPPEIPLTLDKNQFQPSEVKVKANAPFVLVITNKGPKAAAFESKDLRVEKAVPAGRTVTGRIPALKPGTYAVFDDSNPKASG